MRPTSIRRLIVGATALSAVLLYLDRFCVSLAETYIRQDLNLSDQQVSWMFSAFFGTYALAQVPTGWLTDRFGPRRMMTLYILTWSLFTGLMGAAGAASALIVLRFGIGLGQAGAYPTSAALLSRWVPLSGRGISSAIVSLGGRIGGALAPVVAAWLIIVYVPASQPALLTVGDVWKPVDMCRRLQDAGRSAAPDAQVDDATSVWLADRLSEASKTWVSEVLRRARRQAQADPGRPPSQPGAPERLPESIDAPREAWSPLVADIKFRVASLLSRTNSRRHD
jgi:MFS transporter, ACS family, glucarate transporter